MTPNKYYYLNGWFSTKEGLAILHRESSVYDPNHEMLKFDIISPKKQNSTGVKAEKKTYNILAQTIVKTTI